MEIKSIQNKPRQPSPQEGPEKQLKDVASLYEKQFLREMVKQMRTTVNESQFMPSTFAQKYYQEQLDQQYVESWGDQGGIGLGKMIYEKLLERYGVQLGIQMPKEKPAGPISLREQDQWQATFSKDKGGVQYQRKSDSSEQDNAAAPINNPWNGKWLGSYKLENGLQVAEIENEGFKTVLVGDLKFDSIKPNQIINAGDKLGTVLSSGSKFYLKLQKIEK